MSTERNTTQLVVEPLSTPTSTMSVSFSTPELGQILTVTDPRGFEVHFAVDAPEAGALGVDIALDDQRPRRIPVSERVLRLGQLMRADGELLAGAHWLFAAPVLASGLVPRAAVGAARSAVARRFFVGAVPRESSGPSGAVWLRRPEGTYNGPARQHVVFDAFAFNAAGAPLEAVCTIELKAATLAGELRERAPFVVHDIASGDYEAALSAAGASPRVTRFTVNSELGAGP